jgi:hypothetical protein
MLTTCTKPVRDTVLYDGRCGFCRQRVANLQRADLWHRLTFISLHDESVARDFPEVPAERLHDCAVSFEDAPPALATGARAARAWQPADLELALSTRRPQSHASGGVVRNRRLPTVSEERSDRSAQSVSFRSRVIVLA